MRLHSGLISHNLIVEVGAYTVAKNDEGNAVLINQKDSVLPTQWTEAGAAEIMQKCEWKNMHGKVMPITKVGYKQWYQRELDQCMETLEILTA